MTKQPEPPFKKQLLAWATVLCLFAVLAVFCNVRVINAEDKTPHDPSITIVPKSTLDNSEKASGWDWNILSNIVIAVATVVTTIYIVRQNTIFDRQNGIMVRQNRIINEQLRLELYEKRFAVFKAATLDIIGLAPGNNDFNEVQRCLAVLESAPFLFEGPVVSYFANQFGPHVQAFMQTLQDEMQLTEHPSHDGDADLQSVLRRREIEVQWFASQRPTIREMMTPYLDFHQLSAFQEQE